MTQNTASAGTSVNKVKGKRVAPGNKSLVFGITALLLAVVLCVVYVYTTVYLPDTVFSGITFMSSDLSGLTRGEAQLAVQEAISSLGISESIEMTVGYETVTFNTTVNPQAIDAAAIADDAYNYGREGSLFNRFNAIRQAKKEGVQLTCDIAPDRDELLAQVDDALKIIDASSAESLYEIKGDEIIVNLAHGKTYSREAIADALADKITALDFEPFTFEDSNENISAETLKAMVDCEMNEPTVDVNDPTCKTIIPGVTGYSLDLSEAKKALENAEGDSVSIPVTVTKPTYTDAEYKSMLFRDVLSSQSTDFNGNQTARTSNIRIAAKDCETVIMPGAEFSYTEQVGKITREKGYKDALVFSQGEVVDGLGGGVCQVSSTIYMAAMYADMEITVRRNHSFVVSYTPVGQDATFVYGGQDFKFRNNTDFPIKVETEVGKNSITVKIIGTQTTPGKSVKVVTEILSTNPFEVKNVYDPTLQPNATKVKNTGYTGYKANTYRIIYIDGKEVSRNFEATSTYKRLDKVILHGTDPNAPAVNPIEPTAPTEAPEVPVTPTQAPDPEPTTSTSEETTEATQST